MRFWLPFIALGLGSFSLFAQESVELPEVTIHGEKDPITQSAESSSTRVEAADYQNRVMNVPEVLSEQVGVHLTRYGGLEESTSISIRGSQADEVLVLFDGIPLNSAEGGGVNLSNIFIDDLESIEIYRGSAPADAALSPSVGMVSLESKKILTGERYSTSVGYGSFNTLKIQNSASKNWGKFGLLLSNTLSRTSGDFTFLDDNGTPVNVADDRRVARRNNESQTIHPFLKLFYDLDSDTRMEFAAHFIRQDRGVPGMTTNQSQTSGLDTTESMGSLRLTKKHFLIQPLSLESLTFVRAVKNQFSDLNGEIGLGGAQDNDDDTLTFGHKFAADAVIGKYQILSPFVLYQMEWFRPENFLSDPPGGVKSLRHQVNVGSGYTLNLLSDRLRLEPAVWLQNVYNQLSSQDPSFLAPGNNSNTNSHHALAARLGIQGEPHPLLTAQAHVSRSFRFPTFPELFGDRGSVVGNSFLRPQESIQWDLGLFLKHSADSKTFNRIRIGASYFDRHVDDLIQFEQNAGFARAENVGEARVNGVEAEFLTEWFRHLSVKANYTRQNAKDQANNAGRFLVGRPKNEVNAHVDAWIKRGRVFANINWMDESYLDPLNTRRVADRVFLNTGVSVNLHRNWKLSFEAKNLTDEQTVDLIGFPLPGRSFFGRLDWQMARPAKP